MTDGLERVTAIATTAATSGTPMSAGARNAHGMAITGPVVLAEASVPVVNGQVGLTRADESVALQPAEVVGIWVEVGPTGGTTPRSR